MNVGLYAIILNSKYKPSKVKNFLQGKALTPSLSYCYRHNITQLVNSQSIPNVNPVWFYRYALLNAPLLKLNT